MSDTRIRGGTPDDRDALLRLFDKAIAWLAGKGITEQWGAEPASERPAFAARITEFAHDDGCYIATVDGIVAGAVVVGQPPPYVPPATESELYVVLLITDRDYRGHGVGGLLLHHAARLAAEEGAGMLRVDCYAGGEGALVAYYESQGFRAIDSFVVERANGPWPGKILTRRL